MRCRGRVRDIVGSHDIVDGLTISCRHYNGTRVRYRAALRYPIASVRDIVRGARYRVIVRPHPRRSARSRTHRRCRTNQRLVMGWCSGVVVIVDATRHPGGGIGLFYELFTTRGRAGRSVLKPPGVYAPHGRDVRTLRCLGGRVCGPVRSLDRRLRAAYSRLCSSYQLGRLIAPQVRPMTHQGSRPGRAAVRIAWETQPTGHTNSVAGALIRVFSGGWGVRSQAAPARGPGPPIHRVGGHAWLK